MRTAVKIDDNTIHVTWDDSSLHEYKFDFLLAQKDFIVSQRNKEIAEVDELLALCAEVGISVPKEEPILEEKPIAIESVEEVMSPVKKSILRRIIDWVKKIINWFR
jgi:hypothetical protein